MEEERERLNQRISALTGKLAEAKFSSDVEAFNVRCLLTCQNQDKIRIFSVSCSYKSRPTHTHKIDVFMNRIVLLYLN